MYRCHEAVHAFGTLSQQQYNTAWVQCQLGRAAIEMIDYQRAAQCFEKARGLDKFRWAAAVLSQCGASQCSVVQL
jgi:hypothetical protein